MRRTGRAISPGAAAALALAAVAALAAACGPRGGGGGSAWEDAAIRRAKERGRLVVLTEATFHPFEFKDEQGNLVGFDVDLAKALADEAGVAIEFRDRKFDQLQGELDRGQGDFLISGMSVTGERALTVTFSSPYFTTRILALLAVPKADAVKDLRALDAPSRRVVAKLGTTGEKAARAAFPSARIDTLGEDALCALEVAQGRADAFLYDEMQVRRYHADNPKTTRVHEAVVAREPYAIACRAGDLATARWIDTVLDLMRRDGRLDALYAKWFPGEAPPR
jgi:polar amino acid transport system substrate-binding protein